MTINKIEKACPTCNHPYSDIIGASVSMEKGKAISYNIYKCLAKRHHTFKVKRKGNKKEQELTEKFIKSKSIILKE